MIPALAGLFVSALTGWCVCALLWPESRGVARIRILRACLGAALGMLISSILTFIALNLHEMNRTTILSLDLATLSLAAVLLIRRQRAAVPRSPGAGSEEVVLLSHRVLLVALALAILAAGAAVVAVHSSLPYGDWDAWAIWNLKAKFFFAGGSTWSGAFSELIDWSHPDYPLLLPLNVARLWVLADASSPEAAVMLSAFFALLTVGTLFTSLSVLRGRVQGALAGLALLATPAFLMQGASQTADLPVGCFLLGSICAARLALLPQLGQRQLLTISGLLAGAAAWTKNEGILMVLAVLIGLSVTALRTNGPRRAAELLRPFLLGLAAPACCTLILKVAFASRSDLLQDQSLATLVARFCDASRHAMILSAFAKVSWTVPGPWLLTPLAVGLLAAAWLERPRSETLLIQGALPLLIIGAGFYAIYLFTPHDLAFHLASSCHRLFLQLWPSLLFVLLGCVGFPSAALGLKSPK